MGTLGELKARILNETKRPSLTAETDKAILDAIKFYSAKRFWFNEILDESITTEANTPSYSVPENLRRLLATEITVSNQRTDLCSGMSWEDYRYLTGGNNSPGQPTDIIFFGPTSFYLWPTPNDAWLLSLTYCSSLGEFSDSTSSNGWTTEAEPLIRARAKWDLFQNVIRDYQEASACAQVEAEWFGRLQSHDQYRGRPTSIVASDW